MDGKTLMEKDIEFMCDLCEMARDMNLSRDDVRFIADMYRKNRELTPEEIEAERRKEGIHCRSK